MGPRGSRAGWIVVVVVCSRATLAPAQNEDTYYLSDDSSLQAGAITADARGGGSIWYNPAGLAKLPGLRLDVSVSTYALGFGTNPDIDPGSPGSQVTRLSVFDLKAVPAAMSLTHRIGNVGVGFGLFVPTQDTIYLRTKLQELPTSEQPGIDVGLHVDGAQKDYFGGPSFGVDIGPAVSIGASLLVQYSWDLVTSTVDVGFDTGDQTVAAINVHQLRDWIQVGVQPVFGVQLRPSPDWRLGFTIRLPSFRLYQILQTIDAETVAEPGGLEHRNDFAEQVGFSTRVVKPARFHMGVSRQFRELRLALEGSYQLPLRNPDTGQDLGPLWNVRVGGRYRLKDTMAVGGGLFTNRDAQRAVQQFGDSHIDFYGITLAAHLGQDYEVSKRAGKALVPAQGLTFGTTVALTYSLGLGEVVRVEVSPDSFREVPVGVTAHQILLSLGSSISE